MMNFKFVVLIALLIPQIAIGQYNNLECAGNFADTTNTLKNTDCSNSSDAYMSIYRLQNSFIPHTSDFVDEVVIPINLIVLADGDSTKGAYTRQEWENADKTLLMA